MIRALLRYGIVVAVPLLTLILAVGCQSSGRHGRVDACSGCGRSHQSTDVGHSQADDGHDHAHP